MPANPYAKYRENNINSAPREELTLMLYDGALKFCNLAIDAVKAKNIELAHTNIVKVENIIREFQITLDHQYPVSQYFDTMYNYMYERLTEANLKKDADILLEMRDLLRQFRDMWKEAMFKARRETKGTISGIA